MHRVTKLGEARSPSLLPQVHLPATNHAAGGTKRDKMSNSPSEHLDRPESGSYEIRLRGHLDPRWAVRLAVPSLTHDGDGTTMLRATVDQAALHGLLHRVRDLGLTLVSVNRVDDAPNPTPAPERNPK